MKQILSLLLLLAGCADLETYEEGVCGNNVIDAPLEDCDLIADPTLGDGLVCGSVGTPAACRYICGGNAECPSGWACFDDTICRHASGLFEIADEPILLFRADQIELANFVDDDAEEIAIRLDADVTLLSLEEDAESSSLFQANFRAIRGAMTTARIGDERVAILVPAASTFNGDDAEPLVHALEQRGPRLSTAVLPRVAIDLPLDAVLMSATSVRLDDTLGLDDLFYAARHNSGVGVTFSTPACDAMPILLATVDAPSPDAEFVAPKFVRLAGGRQRFALGYVGASQITMGVTSTSTCVRPVDFTTVALPGPLDPSGFDFVRTPDGDNDVDLVVYLAGQRVAVGSGDGDTFQAPVASDRFLPFDDLPDGPSRLCSGERFILTAGAIQTGADRPADFVTEDAIFLSTADGFRRVFTRTRGDAWGEAVIGDFDRDGKPDVVVSTRSRSADCSPTGLQYVRQGSDGSFTSTPIPDVSLPSQLRVGDFDGDGIDDVAVVERARDSGDAVAVLYGDTKEALEDKTLIGGFDEIRWLESTISRDGSDLNVDRVSDLVVVAEADKNLRIDLFGTPRRALVSPISLDGADRQSRGRQNFVIGAGSIDDADDDDPDMLALGSDTAWFLGGADFRAGEPIHKTPLSLAPFRSACALLAVGEGDGPRPVFGVDGYFRENPTLLLEPDAPDECRYVDDDSTLLWVDVNGTPPTFDVARRAAPAGSRIPTQMIVGDLDRNDVDDLVVHFAFRGAVPSGHAVVFWNPTRRGDTIEVSPAEPELILREQIVFSVAALNIDAGDDLELAIYAENGLFTARFDEDTGRLTIPQQRFAPPDFSAEGGPTFLRAGEVTADGLDDLVLLIGEGLFVFPAVPRR